MNAHKWLDWLRHFGHRPVLIAKELSPQALLNEDRAEFERRAAEIWLAYHDNADWAQRKLAAGLIILPEGLAYMERELFARAEQRKHDDAIKKELPDEPTLHVQERPVVGSESHPAPGGDTAHPGSGAQEAVSRLHSEQSAAREGTGSEGGGDDKAGRALGHSPFCPIFYSDGPGIPCHCGGGDEG